ncbi:hypothetical protein J2X65_004690 [Ancylobacter sp. 3268]|nr:hypothetical protein [Ancylobacter sp. 3268]
MLIAGRFPSDLASRFSKSRRTDDARANISQFGIKELRSLARDPILPVLIVSSFTVSIYTALSAMPEVLNRTAITIADEDQTPVSSRLIAACYPPYFAKLISHYEMDRCMDAGLRYLRARHSAEFPMRPPRRSLAHHPLQRGCDANATGVFLWWLKRGGGRAESINAWNRTVSQAFCACHFVGSRPGRRLFAPDAPRVRMIRGGAHGRSGRSIGGSLDLSCKGGQS